MTIISKQNSMLTLHVTEEWIALFIPQWTDFRWILNLHSYELSNA
jgi:hypothetical protein